MNSWKVAALFSLVSVGIGSNLQATEQPEAEIYFDLGNVVVDTSDWNQVKYMPTAKEYLDELQSKNYKINLMVNFVDKLGDQVFSTCEDKFAGLVNFLDSKWSEPSLFDWEQFGKIILPPKDAHRKPGPFMFVNSLISSCPAPLLYLGENPAEIEMARFLGMSTWLVERRLDFQLIPLDQIDEHVRSSFRYGYPSDCQATLYDRCELSRVQMAEIIAAERNRIELLPPDLLEEDRGKWTASPL